MSKTVYVGLDQVTDLQKEIMQIVVTWARKKRVPIPHKTIFTLLKDRNRYEIEFALKGLVKQGFIRRAVVISNKTFYVQLRTI